MKSGNYIGRTVMTHKYQQSGWPNFFSPQRPYCVKQMKALQPTIYAANNNSTHAYRFTRHVYALHNGSHSVVCGVVNVNVLGW